MLFGEKLKAFRTSAHMSQTALAKYLNISLRTIQNYEGGRSYPKQTELYARIGELFGVSADFLLSDSDRYIIDAADKGGKRAAHEVKELVTEIGGLFAGGELSEEDKDKVMRAINDLYWKAKEKNRKKEDGEESILSFDVGEE